MQEPRDMNPIAHLPITNCTTYQYLVMRLYLVNLEFTLNVVDDCNTEEALRASADWAIRAACEILSHPGLSD